MSGGVTKPPSAGDDIEERRARGRIASRLLGEPQLPVRVARYLILDRVGQGGLGAVYAAFDPQLDRKVALKLVRDRERGRPDGGDDQARLVREAQTMAKLAHPNVVHVYDAGIFEGQVFIAMQFVAGTSLRGWLQGETRDWRTTCSVFAQAGRGLAAAHDEGIVHRDFKPDNVLIDAAGHVYVADFGLARSDARPPPSVSDTRPSSEPRMTRHR